MYCALLVLIALFCHPIVYWPIFTFLYSFLPLPMHSFTLNWCGYQSSDVLWGNGLLLLTVKVCSNVLKRGPVVAIFVGTLVKLLEGKNSVFGVWEKPIFGLGWCSSCEKLFAIFMYVFSSADVGKVRIRNFIELLFPSIRWCRVFLDCIIIQFNKRATVRTES
jgi:hypothetical protein